MLTELWKQESFFTELNIELFITWAFSLSLLCVSIEGGGSIQKTYLHSPVSSVFTVIVLWTPPSAVGISG